AAVLPRRGRCRDRSARVGQLSRRARNGDRDTDRGEPAGASPVGSNPDPPRRGQRLGVVSYVGTGRLGVVATAGALWGVVIGTMIPLQRTLLQINAPESMVG